MPELLLASQFSLFAVSFFRRMNVLVSTLLSKFLCNKLQASGPNLLTVLKQNWGSLLAWEEESWGREDHCFFGMFTGY